MQPDLSGQLLQELGVNYSHFMSSPEQLANVSDYDFDHPKALDFEKAYETLL